MPDFEKRRLCMNKTKKAAVVCLFVFAAVTVYGQTVVTLDTAITEAAAYLTGRLPQGTRTAVVNCTAPAAVSSYVIEELTVLLVNHGSLVMVDRSEMDLLQQEMRFQLSGEVSDETAQAIGKRLGAQTVISGSLNPLGSKWTLRIKALEVETSKVQGSQSFTIKRNATLSNLLPGTAGEKIGTGFLNLVLGLGSYIEGDVSGGLTLTAGYAVSAGLFAVEATMLDWDDPAVGVPATIGVSLAGLTLVYGFVRPYIYNRSPQVTAVLDHARINLVSTAKDDRSQNKTVLQVSYSITGNKP
jgi:hypothetical protein